MRRGGIRKNLLHKRGGEGGIVVIWVNESNSVSEARGALGERVNKRVVAMGGVLTMLGELGITASPTAQKQKKRKQKLTL